MLDVRAIRDDPETYRAGLGRRNMAAVVDELLAADERWRRLTVRVEELRAEQNRASKAIGGAQGDQKQAKITEVGKVSAELKTLEPELEEADAALARLLATTPNVPHPSAPDGFSDEDAQEIKRVGEPPSFFTSRRGSPPRSTHASGRQRWCTQPPPTPTATSSPTSTRSA